MEIMDVEAENPMTTEDIIPQELTMNNEVVVEMRGAEVHTVVETHMILEMHTMDMIIMYSLQRVHPHD